MKYTAGQDVNSSTVILFINQSVLLVTKIRKKKERKKEKDNKPRWLLEWLGQYKIKSFTYRKE